MNFWGFLRFFRNRFPCVSGGETLSVSLPLADGYYYVTNASVPTISGAVSGPNLHDGSDGDTATGYSNAAGNAVFFAFRVKSAGMTFDGLHASPGYNNTLSVGWYGSNDGATWTAITTDTPAFSTHVSFSYTAYQFSCNSTTYKMVGILVTDSGGNSLTLQAGDADLRIFSGVSEVA